MEPECSQVCKFVKEFRPDLLGVCTAGIEVPCKLVEVSAHPAALGKQGGNGGQGFFSAAGNDDRFLDLDVLMHVELLTPVAMEEGLRFAIREGGRTVGSGVVGKIIE